MHYKPSLHYPNFWYQRNVVSIMMNISTKWYISILPIMSPNVSRQQCQEDWLQVNIGTFVITEPYIDIQEILCMSFYCHWPHFSKAFDLNVLLQFPIICYAFQSKFYKTYIYFNDENVFLYFKWIEICLPDFIISIWFIYFWSWYIWSLALSLLQTSNVLHSI